MNNRDNRTLWKGACHCGAVQFTVRLTDGMNTARRCSCSYCSMRGAVAVSANLDDIEIISGQDILSLYQFNTGTAKHHFCSRCGIYTHHQRRSNPHQYGVNVACLDGVSPLDFAVVPVYDGQNHPKDSQAPTPATIGQLRFEPGKGQPKPRY
ncbi:MAG: GFA family protein [Sphingobium sp.]|nr:GFA family protein [Sphingobium sp.]